jgi:hypothetical protein
MSLKYLTLDQETEIAFVKDQGDWPGEHLSLKARNGTLRFGTISKGDPLTVTPDDGPSETYVSVERMLEDWMVD